MSYSLETPCCNFHPSTPPNDCLKKDTCTDRHILYGAVCAIHQMPFGVGHLGAGTITLTCNNKVVAESMPKERYVKD